MTEQPRLIDAANAGASALNITAATVIKAAPGRVFTATVVVAGSGAGSINDCAATGDVDATNEIATLPASVQNILLGGFPCFTGITVTPGSGQTIAVSFA